MVTNCDAVLNKILDLICRNVKENTKGHQTYDPAQDPVLNEFKRENLLHRQAQAAVLEGIKRLKEFGIPTRRPVTVLSENL